MFSSLPSYPLPPPSRLLILSLILLLLILLWHSFFNFSSVLRRSMSPYHHNKDNSNFKLIYTNIKYMSSQDICLRIFKCNIGNLSYPFCNRHFVPSCILTLPQFNNSTKPIQQTKKKYYTTIHLHLCGYRTILYWTGEVEVK